MNKSKYQLQIKQLSPNGQLLNCVNCFSGQVSVLRTNTQAAIRPYMNALAGISGPERFIIEIEHEPYVPHANNLIGFGERFVPDDGNVEEYLSQNKIPQNLINSLLVSYGLENCSNLPCAKLNRCEERRLRILAAVYDASKILVINDPFDPISSEWRERFAELLVNFARTKSQIVIVPFLSYRPECWIDNEFIARIQVGESIQKTIGFTSQSTNIQAMINQIREEHKSDSSDNIAVAGTSNVKSGAYKQAEPRRSDAVNLSELQWDEEQEAAPLEEEIYNEKQPALRRHFSKIMATGFAFVILFFLFSDNGKKAASSVAGNQTLPASQQNSAVIEPNPDISNELPAKPNLPEQPAQEGIALPNLPKTEIIEPTEQRLALVMRYPEHIKDSIIRATNSKAATGLIKKNIEGSEGTSNKKNAVASDFLKLLATAGSSSENSETQGASEETGSNESPPDPSYGAPNEEYVQPDSTDEQARREQIRQKFLEAIQRAQERSE